MPDNPLLIRGIVKIAFWVFGTLSLVTLVAYVIVPSEVAAPYKVVQLHQPNDTDSSLNAHQMSLRQISRVIPPIPILEELSSIIHFVYTSLDDVAEDVTKLACLVGVHRLTVMGVGSLLLFPVHATVFGLFGSALAFNVCDILSDMIGNQAEFYLLTLFGFPTAAPLLKTTGQRRATMSIVDDVMEDSAKIVCMYTHFRLGFVLMNNFFPTSWGIVGEVLGRIMAIATPVSRYSSCNRYADNLGDTSQQYLSALIDFSFLDPDAMQHNPLPQYRKDVP